MTHIIYWKSLFIISGLRSRFYSLQTSCNLSVSCYIDDDFYQPNYVKKYFNVILEKKVKEWWTENLAAYIVFNIFHSYFLKTSYLFQIDGLL